MHYSRCFLFLFLLAALAGCGDRDEKNFTTTKQIYSSYSISADEGDEFVTAFLQFHAGRPNGPTLNLPQPSQVFLDSLQLQPDSAGQSGYYYEAQMPLEEFVGSHTIRFINADKIEYRQKFNFQPFRMVTDVKDIVKRQDLVFHLAGLKEKDALRIVLSDTSFKGEGVNRRDSVYNNRLDLRKFSSLISNGPVMLQLFREEEKLFGERRGVWGEISVTYGLKREFELKD